MYAIGSYVQEGVAIRTAGELAATDCPKQLHLVMERDVTGEAMAAAFTTAIRQGHPAPAFAPGCNRTASCSCAAADGSAASRMALGT